MTVSSPSQSVYDESISIYPQYPSPNASQNVPDPQTQEYDPFDPIFGLYPH